MTAPLRSRGAPANEVRIVGGVWKRSKLRVSDKPGLRPTPDRVRETLFNWLGQDLTGWRVLDAFAGSGALGFEAASRGAAEVVLLERERDLVSLMREAQQRLKATALRIEQADALSWMRSAAPERFDLVLIDPPFESNLAAPAVDAASRLVVPGGWLYLESGEACDTLPADFTMHRQSRAGAVHFHLMQCGRYTARPDDRSAP
jgi:16S rRNA (guanine(966)-N(2))-methyltransferase RsmD